MAKKANWKGILLGVAVGAALLMSGGALIRSITSEKTKELSASAYSIGAVTDEGKLDNEDKTSIYTNKFDVADLVSVEIEEDAKVQVFLHYYDAEDAFMQSVEVVAGEELAAAPEGAETFRVEITPTDDDDGKVGVFEKADYAKLVTVTLKK